jgi:hypothetical protein
MRFKVIGSRKETGARVQMEVEAESKAAAEKKSLGMGVVPNSIVDISDGEPQHTGVKYEGKGGKRAGLNPLVKLILLVAILAAAWYFLWPMLRGG